MGIILTRGYTYFLVLGKIAMLKEHIKQVVDEFPDDVDVDELMEKIYLLRKIELAEKQFSEGDVFTHEEVEEQMKSWLK
jgi:hypothetical protein